MEILKHKDSNQEYIEKYHLKCQCGCQFIANWDECDSMEKKYKKRQNVVYLS